MRERLRLVIRPDCIRFLFATALAGALVSGAAQAAAGDIYYVDTNSAAASDSNDGSEARPWKTIQKAAATLKAGETVYVKAGTYRELYTGGPDTSVTGIKPQNSGTATAPITFRVYPGQKVVIDQGQQGAGFFIYGKHYITISGFEITNAKTGGVYTKADPSNIVVKDNHIHHVYAPAGANGGAIKFDDCGYCTADGNLLHHVYVGGTIGNQNTAGVHSYDMHHTTISNNEIYSAYSGVFHKRSAGQKGAVVRNNFIHDVNHGVWYSVGGAGDPAHVDQEVYENVFVNASSAGIYAKTDETATVSKGLAIHNNVFRGGKGITLKGYQGVNIWNNIFRDVSPAITTISGDRPPLIAYADYNLYWTGASFLLDQYGSNTSYSSLSAWQAASHPHLATRPGAHDFVADPAFVDMGANDFHLTATSVARDRGRNSEDLGAYPDFAFGNPPAAPVLIEVK